MSNLYYDLQVIKILNERKGTITMTNIRTIATTDKGALKTQVRKEIVASVYPQIAEVLADLGFEFVSDKNAYVMTLRDNADTNVYVTLDASISLKHPTDRAVKKTAPKAKAEAEAIVIE